MAGQLPASMKPLASLPNRRVAISVEGESVTVEIMCGDAYLAQVIFDDITERLRAGTGIVLELEQPEPTK